ncbi:MAG TPA: hypothetical protein VHQ68_05330, partial [Propionibacteriaceae bacterium]|nr:hypothetical protein [Propionibacteriaceae bacterium]
ERDFVRPMPTPAPLDLEALSLDDLKRLVVELLLRVAAQEDEIRALREENAHLKSLPKRPKLAPGGMDKATEPDKQRQGQGGPPPEAQGSHRAAHAAGPRGANPHGDGAAGLAPQGL